MWANKIKWMVIGMAVTGLTVWIFNNREKLKNLSGSRQNYTSFAQVNPEFASYISAFTTGYVSSGAPVRIKLSSEFVSGAQLNTPLDEDFFDFEPSIQGTTVWKDAQTLEFKPNERLKPGQVYKATFDLSKLVNVKKELKEFEFGFEVIKQAVMLEINELKSYSANDFNYYSLTGNVITADWAEADQIEKTLSISYNGKYSRAKWMHNEKGTSHKFLIDSIERPGMMGSKITIACNAESIGNQYKSEQTLEVPKKSKYELLSVKLKNESDQYVLLTFSNPLKEDQSLESFIGIYGMREVKYIMSNNQVMLYPSNPQPGTYTLSVYPQIRDAHSETLEERSMHAIVFNEVKPAVKFAGEGNILPSTHGLTLPFETVNLRAVDVKIIKIYENNVLQFLQNNDLNGTSYMAQVGKQVLEKRINLGITNPSDFSVWKKSSLDLSNLIKTEPGAIYRVKLSFKKSYSTYPCVGNNSDDKFEMEQVQESKEDENSYFGYYYDSDYDYSYYEYDANEEYNYGDRENPCKSAYYRDYSRRVYRNILASDIGLTYKKGNDGSIFAVAANLVDAKPMDKVTIELYDFQKQLIQSAQTNSDGQALISPSRKPSFVVARKDKQCTYLRLDDASVLPLTMYNVSGEAIKKGVKGFIYGERGVWRPGDSLFLNFILEDKQVSIPANHPVMFDLYNPQGQLYKRIFSNKSVDGFYCFKTATDMNAPTGNWSVEVKIGSIRFSKNIRIETIMPNRLKINLNIGDNQLITTAKKTEASLHTNWLTGAPAKNLAANITAAISSDHTSFEKYNDYHFNDNTIHFEARNVTVFDGNVDEEGNVTVPVEFGQISSAPGFLHASFVTKVFEPGGAFSIDRFSMTYSPFRNYVGMKLPVGERNSGIVYTGRDQTIEVVTVDERGNKVSIPNLKFEMYKLEWRWWWDSYSNEVAGYSYDEYHRPVYDQTFSSSNGSAKVKIKVEDEDWGRYLVRITDTDGGHSTSMVTYFDWANWMDRDGGSGNKIIANMLNFTSDKNSYKAGEKAKITIPSPANGRALVTIENGSRVVEAHWLETEKGNTTFELKITPQMAPNVYVHVSLLQPHSHENDLPIRMYGVVPISIDDPETHLKPVIKMPEVLEPEKEVTITVSEENKKEMAFTLAVVDEGLLDITRFKTPNPHSNFYAKEALGVKTWDIYDKVMGAYGAELERVLSIGGDEEGGKSEDGSKANRFKPMVRFFGPYHLDKGDKHSITFKMPTYVGSVRTMVIAGYKGAYGRSEKTTPVKAPIMLLGTLPRVLSVTEEVKLPVSVFGGDKNIGNTQVKIEVNDLVQVVGAATKNVNIKKDDEQLVTFDLKVKNQSGIARVKIIANGGGHNAVYEMELDVRNPNPYQTTVKDFWVDAGKSIKESVAGLGLSGTNSGVLEFSTIPPVNMEERLRYLITYPHGCIEQTTSGAFAQLYLDEVLDLSASKKTAIEENVKHGLNRLLKFQISSGAFSYWPGDQTPNDWGTSYAGHFMLCAEKKGYSLPSGLKSAWIRYQQNKALNFEIKQESHYYSYDVQQAYRLYVLALAGNPVMSAMNRLREYKDISAQAVWLLASAYAQAGQIDEAEKLINKTGSEIKPYRVNYYTYGSSERDMAIILHTLCSMNKKSQALAQLKKVTDFLSSKSWLSTQTTAYGLVAVAEFVRKYGGNSAMQAVCTVNGKDIELKGRAPVTQVDMDFKGNNANFEVKNNGKGGLYVRLVNRGKPAMGEEKEDAENITATLAYKDLSGREINPGEIAQGSNFMVSVTVRNSGVMGHIKNLALSNYMPSGWEIGNSRLDDNEAALKNSAYDYQDVRDDRIFTYFDLKSGETKTFNFMVNATYEGKYYLPAVNVEAMYDNSVYARTKGQWVRVVKKVAEQGVAGK